LSSIIVGVDIGTSFVHVVIGELNETGNLEIVAVSKNPSDGVRNGVIVNIEKAVAVIQETVGAAEQIAGCDVRRCVTAIGGANIESRDSTGMAVISTKEHSRRDINVADVNTAITSATAIYIAMDRQILHVIPKEYIVDSLRGFKDPIGTSATRLEVETHIVTASKTGLHTLEQCFMRAGYELVGAKPVMLKTLAATKATLLGDEQELGSILIDMGGGTTDVLVLCNEAPVCTASIPIGSNFITNDISTVLGIPFEVAEKLKIESGCCWGELVNPEETIIIPGVGGRPPAEAPRLKLCEIIQARVIEIFTEVLKEVKKKSTVKKMSGSIVLTGGGALLSGVVELAEAVFRTSAVRIGEPGNLGGSENLYRNPEYATAVGLVLENKNVAEVDDVGLRTSSSETKKSSFNFGSIMQRLIETFF
jgi:cell division protein FtsA